MIFAPVIRHSAYHPGLRAVDRNLERFLAQTLLGQPNTTLLPTHRFEQDDNHFTLQVDLPGLGREQLLVDIEKNQVRIESSADAPRKYKSSFELPVDIDANNSQARLENGVLYLTLAKKKADKLSTRLSVI
jgi:HSP20 family molecular chaperone IbpA